MMPRGMADCLLDALMNLRFQMQKTQPTSTFGFCVSVGYAKN